MSILKRKWEIELFYAYEVYNNWEHGKHLEWIK